MSWKGLTVVLVLTFTSNLSKHIVIVARNSFLLTGRFDLIYHTNNLRKSKIFIYFCLKFSNVDRRNHGVGAKTVLFSAANSFK